MGCTDRHDVVWYRRTFDLPAAWAELEIEVRGAVIRAIHEGRREPKA